VNAPEIYVDFRALERKIPAPPLRTVPFPLGGTEWILARGKE
jgi:hypothetical protein